MPFVETMDQALHFKKGSEVYEGGIYPYREAITSPYRDRIDQGPPGFGTGANEFPWNQDWLPKADS